MKKLKRASKWEDRELDVSEEMKLDLGAMEEDIIELDEIVELPDDELDTAESDMEVEILDAESDLDLDLNELDLELEEKNEDLAEEDLLSRFSFDEVPADDGEIAAGSDRMEKDSGDKEFEELISLEGAAFLGLEEELKKATPEERSSSGTVVPVEEASEGETAVPLEDLVAQIEARLTDAVRQMVESRLPDIVRNVLREEIERLREELKKE